MSEGKAKESKVGGKVIFDEYIIYDVIEEMNLSKAFPEGKVTISCVKDLEGSKVIIDLDERKFIFSKYCYNCIEHPSNEIYLNHIYDLNKVDLNKFLWKIITKTRAKTEIKSAVEKIFGNAYLRGRFYRLLRNSSRLRKSFKKKVEDYEDKMQTKLSIWLRINKQVTNLGE